MNVFYTMNIIIEYIENHITESVEPERLSKLTGLNIQALKTIFSCLVGCGLKEYIRRRRLSICIEDLKKGEKVIDVALKYGYNSPNSFTRAFKNFHGISPKQIKNSEINLSLCNRAKFNEENLKEINIKYKIYNHKKITLYGVYQVFSKDELASNIEEFWKEVKKVYPVFLKEKKRYGLIEDIEEGKKYFCLVDHPYEGFIKKELPSTNYLALKMDSFKANDISNKFKICQREYINSLHLKQKNQPRVEIYNSNCVELLIPIN